MTTDDIITARAYLDADKRYDALTDDQRAAASKRRQILGSLDDTHALNRSERGSAGAIALLFAVLAVAPLGAMRWLGPVWAGGLVIAVALVWLAVGCCTAPARLRDRLDAEAPKGGAL